MSKPERFTNATGAPVPDNTADPAYGDGVARALKLNVFLKTA
jgi:hypothetical protein